MHFLDIIRTVRRESGGPAEGLRRIVDGYLAAGHTAEILSLDPAEDAPDDLPVPLHALGRSMRGYGLSPRARIWLRDNAHRFDGIVIQGVWQFPGLLALLELKGRHPYVVFTHGMLDPWFNRTYPLKFLKKLPYWMMIERRVLAGAHRVLFTCMLESQLAPQSFPLSHWTPAVVPYGTAGPPNDSLADQAADAEAFYSAAGLAPGAPFLLYAGRIQEKKGCDLLINAYAAVSRDIVLPPLVMAGPDQGGLVAQLKAIAAERGITDSIVWPGMITGRAKWGAFREAEAFVLPSHQENFGIAVAEALSCGTPVLISDQVNIHADVSACQAGYVEQDTLEGTVALLRRWAHTSPEEREHMRTLSRECWRGKFDSAGTSRAIIDLFRGQRSRLTSPPS